MTVGGRTMPLYMRGTPQPPPAVGQHGPSARAASGPSTQPAPSARAASGPSARPEQLAPTGHSLQTGPEFARVFSLDERLAYNQACTERTELIARAVEADILPNPFQKPEKRCSIQGCEGRARNLKVHGSLEHFPWWYHPSVACFVCKRSEKDLTSMRRLHGNCGPDPEDKEYCGLGQLAPAVVIGEDQHDIGRGRRIGCVSRRRRRQQRKAERGDEEGDGPFHEGREDIREC